MYQSVTIVGNLGADPELRYTPSGIPVTRFNVATNRRWTDDAGDKQEETTWFRVTVWRRQAETCNQYLTKGRTVLVNGRIETRSWEKDGATQYGWELVARDVRFLGGEQEITEDMPPRIPPEPAQDEIPF